MDLVSGTKMKNLYNNEGPLNDKQSLYDYYNNFIISDDRNLFFKLIMRNNLFEKVKHLNGDIVECGVFKGAGLLVWLKLIDMYQSHSIKKVIGFDFFNPTFVDELKNKIDRETMRQVFTRCNDLSVDEVSIEGIENKILNSGFKKNKFELIKGDISETSKEFLTDKPGFRISLLYLDLDLEKPTLDTLENFYDRIVPGGIIVFDEYAYHCWSESNAVDEFINKKQLKLINTHLQSPTAYLIKE
jgi:hypothetical protein